MFEKEAEEYVDLSGNRNYTERAFKDGAEFGYNKAEKELVKAKEIIKRFSRFVNNDVEYDPEHPQEHTDLWNELCKQAEQFLKEISE